MTMQSKFPGVRAFASALALLGGLMVSIPSQALTVTLSGVSANTCTYTTITVDSAGNTTVNCAVASAPGTIGFGASSYAVSVGSSTPVSVTRTGGTTGAVSANISATSGVCSVDNANPSFAAGASAPITVNVTGISAATCTLSLAGATGGASLGAAALVTVNPAGGPGTLNFAASSYTVAQGSTTSIAITRTGGSTGQVGATISATSGVCSVNNPTVSFNDAVTTQVTLTLSGTTQGTCTLALGAATGGVSLGANATAQVTAPGGGSGSCPAAPTGTINSAFASMGTWIAPAPASNQVVAIPLPNFHQSNGYTFTTTVISLSQLATSPVEPMSIALSIAACPGEMVGMGPNCQRVGTNRSGDEIKFATYDPVYYNSKAKAELYGYCWIPPGTAPSTLYLNVRYSYSSCGYGVQSCGFSMQWNIYDGFAHNP